MDLMANVDEDPAKELTGITNGNLFSPIILLAITYSIAMYIFQN